MYLAKRGEVESLEAAVIRRRMYLVTGGHIPGLGRVSGGQILMERGLTV